MFGRSIELKGEKCEGISRLVSKHKIILLLEQAYILLPWKYILIVNLDVCLNFKTYVKA